MKRLFCIALAFAFAVLPIMSAVAADPINVVVGNTFGVTRESDVDLSLAAAGLSRGGSTPFTVTFAPGVMEIGWAAFVDCTSMTSIVIPDSVFEIGDGAFYNCTSLTEIVIPSRVAFIGLLAFENCANLYDVYFESKTPPKVDLLAFNNIKPGARAHVPHGAAAYGPQGSLWNGLVVTYGAKPILRGDVDGDGVIDSADITLLRRYIAAENKDEFLDENPMFNKDNADVNGDGIICAEDVALLRQYVSGWLQSLPL